MRRCFLAIIANLLVLAGLGGTAGAQVSFSRWSMDSIEHGVVVDASGGGLDGAVRGTPNVVRGRIGQALRFNGDGDYIRFDDPGADGPFDRLGPFSIAAWINPEVLGGTRQIMSKDNVFEFEIGRSGANRYGIRLNNGGQGRGSTPIVTGQWQHVAVTWDGTTVSYYYNGALDGSDPFTGPMRSNNKPMGIGSRPGRYFFQGALDEILFVYRALTAEEISEMAAYGQEEPPQLPDPPTPPEDPTPTPEEPPTPTSEDLVSHWPMDTAAGGFTPDVSGGIDGRVDGSPGIIPGVIGPSFEFDGVDDKIAIRDTGLGFALDITAGLTVAAWIRPSAFSGTRSIISKDNAFEFEFGRRGADRLQLRLNNGERGRANTPLTQGEWQHVAATWDGSTVTYYRNGIEDGSAPFAGPIQANNRHVYLGARGNRYRFAGAMDDVRIYRAALSAGNIAILAGVVAPEPTPPEPDPVPPPPEPEPEPEPEPDPEPEPEPEPEPDPELPPPPPRDPEAFHPTKLDNLKFFVESVYGITPVNCNTQECWNQMPRYCDTDRFPNGCIRRWEDQSVYVPKAPREFKPPQWTAGRDFGQDDHEKPELVLDCINGFPCARGAIDADSSGITQSHSFEIEIADLFAPVAGAVSLYLLARPIQQFKDYYFFGTTGTAMRHVVVDNRLALRMGTGPEQFVTATGSVEIGKWQLFEIHRDEANTVQVIINGVDRTLGTPSLPGNFDFRFLFTRNRGNGMFGDIASSLIYGDALTDAEKVQVRDYFFEIYDLQNLPAPPPEDPIGPLATYYIDADLGSDLNIGSSTAPFRSVQHCVDQWTNRTEIGAHISCQGRGVFHEEVIIRGSGPDPDRRNQLTAWDTDGDGLLSDETFVLDGQNVRNVGIRATEGDPRNVEVAWLTIRNYRPDNGFKCPEFNGIEPADERLHFIQLRGSTGRPVSDWWIHDNEFQNLGEGCGADGSFIAIRPTNAPNLLVENNRFDNMAGFLFRYFGGDNITIRNNVFSRLDWGIKAWSTGLPINNLQVTGNTFNCQGVGAATIFSNDVQNGLISGNTYNNCQIAISLGTDRDFGTRDNAGHVIENNLIYTAGGAIPNWGIGIKINDCSGPSKLNGAYIEVRDVIIRNNVIWRTGSSDKNYSGIYMRSGHLHEFDNNVQIYNNTVSGAKNAIRLDHCGAVRDPSGIVLPATANLNGVDIQNNIFANSADRQLILVGGWPTLPVDVTTDFNVYSGSGTWVWFDGSRTRAMSRAEYNSITGNGASSAFCAPSFTADGDFHLSGTGACAAGQGVTLAAVPIDIDGQDRIGDYDIGADQGGVASKGMAASDEKPEELPGRFELGPNYPNPFNPTTTITFEIPEAGHVRLEVFDALGKRVALLIDGERSKGRHEATFVSRGQATGAYYYRVQTDRHSAVRPMMLLR